MTPAMRKVNRLWLGVLFLAFLSGCMAQQESWEQLVRTGNSYRQQGRYVEAERELLTALREAENVPTPDVPLATTLNNLALLYQDQGRYQEAERLYQQALDTWHNVAPQGDNTTTVMRKNLATLFLAQGRYQEAERLFREVLAVWEKLFGPDSPETAIVLNELGTLFYDQKQYSRAEQYYRRVLQIREKAFGLKHPEVAGALNNLASIYTAEARYPEAALLYEQALSIRVETLGPEHPAVGRVLNNLATLMQNQHRYQESETLLQRALAISEKSGGFNHPEVAMELNNLAQVYQLQGRYNEAEPLYRRAIAINKKTLGPNHPRLALSLNSYADLLRKTGRKREAARLEKQARGILVITSEQYRNLPVDVHALPAIGTGSGRLVAPELIPLATAATAAADNPERMLFVYLYDRHLVESATLAGAKPIVARMFAEIGIRVQWRTGDPRPQLDQGCGHRSVGVRFAAQSQQANVDATVLASTLPYTAGIPITILLGQLSPLSRSKPSHARALLAHVLVHEISHVLGINGHSESGVMRAFWSDDEKNEMVERPLPFTPDDVAVIHRGMGKIGTTGCGDLQRAAQ